MSQSEQQDGRTDAVNGELVSELLRAGSKSFTGSIEVIDRATKNHARLFMYAGGLYAVDLEGYPRPVLTRLRSAGLLANRTPVELDLLRGLDTPDPILIGTAVDRGWVSTTALANVHQELLLASLGRVICLPKIKTRQRKGETTSQFCTLPLPVGSVFDTLRMRDDRMQGTWSMLAQQVDPGNAVLVMAGASLDDRPVTPEIAAMIREIDGVRSLDAIAFSVGFTRAEAVHVASALIRSGLARIDADAEPVPVPSHYLVPEAFGSHRVEPVSAVVVPPTVAPARAATAPAAVPDPVQAPPSAPPRLPVQPVLRPVDDVDERERALLAARAEVARLHGELQASVRAEQEAINHTAEVSQRLRDARVTLANIEMAEFAPLGIA